MAAIVSLISMAMISSHQENPIDQARWLLGEWVSKTGVHEQWQRQRETSFSGRSFFMNGKDTMVMETIQLEQRGNDLFYIPTVKNQNGGQPVPFKMTKISAGELVFENPDHDFPQKISYTKVGMDSLHAEISGTINGKERSKLFPMRRLK